MAQSNLTPEERRKRYEAFRSRKAAEAQEAVNTDEAERLEREEALRKRRVRLRQQQKEEEKLRKRRRTVIFVMAEMVVFLLLSITCYGIRLLGSYQFEELDKDVYKESISSQSNASAEPRTSEIVITDEAGSVVSVENVTLPDEPRATGFKNILILGLDKGDNGNRYGYDDDGRNADVIIIVSINNETGEVHMASVMRDMILKQEEGSYHAYGKANDQYAQSGLSDTVSMINRNFGLAIDEYVTINWYSVATLINQLGGVEMEIPNEAVLAQLNGYLTDVNETTGIWAPQLPAPGVYNLSGTQAVAFCRIRKVNGWNDDGRTNNQREVIMKLFEKAKQLFKEGQINVLLGAAKEGLANVKTNLRLPEILRMLMEIESYTITGSLKVPVSYETDEYLGSYFSKYHVDWPVVATDFEGEVRNLHQFLYNDTAYEPSDFIKKISEQMTKDRKNLE